MRPVSDRFLKALRGSHARVVQAFVVAPGQTGVEPTGTEIPIISGDVQLDATASIRSTLDITTLGKFPTSTTDMLNVYGNEIFVRRGISFGSGDIEWVSLGYFRIHSVEQAQAPDGPISIAAQDRMAGIVEARLLKPKQFLAATTYGTVVNQLVQEVYPWATVSWDDLSYTDAIGRSVICEEDRYEFLDELVTSLGKIWYWDHRGVLVIRSAASLEDPVWLVNSGENGVLSTLSRDLSREGVYNAVVADGEALDTVTPARAVAVDNNPASPTYYYGSFGKVPRFYSSSFITNTSQAQTAANSLLRQKLGLPYNVDFTAVPNPALEPYDPVVVNAAGSLNPEAKLLVKDSFSRTVTGSWGTADSGQAWSLTGAAFNIDGGAATYTITPDNVALSSLAGDSAADVEGQFTVSVPNLPTGATFVVGAVTRHTGTTNNYQLRIEFRTDGKIGCKISRWFNSSLEELATNNPVDGLTFTPNQIFRVRFRNVGTKLKIKIWIDGQAEPATWTLETTDDAYTFGRVGLWGFRVPGNTNTGVQAQIHEFTASTYPAIPSGAEVHVIEKLTIPLVADQPMTATTREQTPVVIGEA
jgi:hypothetical protein